MYYADYVTRLMTGYASIPLEPGCREIGPLHVPTRMPKSGKESAPWKMDWAVLFPDGKHAYVYERWFPMRPSSPGAAKEGYRAHFSFHYGKSNLSLRPDGIPARDKVNCPAIIRIDLDRHCPHLHFHAELPHIQQNQVAGMNIVEVDPFVFMRAVLEHRASDADFDTIMKFTVIP